MRMNFRTLYRRNPDHENPPTEDPAVAHCPGAFGDPMGVGVSYERGEPVALPQSGCLPALTLNCGRVVQTRQRWSGNRLGPNKLLRSDRLDLRDARYRGTSLIRKRTLLGPYRRPMHRVLGWSQGGGRFLWARYPCSCECV